MKVDLLKTPALYAVFAWIIFLTINKENNLPFFRDDLLTPILFTLPLFFALIQKHEIDYGTYNGKAAIIDWTEQEFLVYTDDSKWVEIEIDYSKILRHPNGWVQIEIDYINLLQHRTSLSFKKWPKYQWMEEFGNLC